MCSFNFKQAAKNITIIALIVLNLYVVLTVVAYATDITIPYLNINPPEATYQISFLLVYPPATGPLINEGNGSQLNAAFNVTLTYNGTLVERQPVLMTADGSFPPQFANDVQLAFISFEGATLYQTSLNNTPLTFAGLGVVLNPNSTVPTDANITNLNYGYGLVGSPILVDWPIQGDYYPTLIIVYYNHSIPPIVHEYQDYHLHVNSSDVLQQEKYSKINTAISIALLWFALIESFVFIFSHLLPKKHQDNGK